MSILFISHSSLDNGAAVKVRDWLKENGWGQVFLDLDPQQGLAPGQRWQQELKQAGERCSAVVVLISPHWAASPWCKTEFLLADQLGKRIFPVFVAPTPFDDLPVELKAKFQLADISTPEKEADGFAALAVGLKRAGLDPGSFGWPPPADPHRPIYRGLQSLDEEDAAVFFGRDALITKGLDALRRMRDGTPERMLVILGASGAGKSSFLKAGLIARLKRDEECFLVLPTIRPEREALSGDRGLAAALGLSAQSLNSPNDIVDAIAKLRALAVARLKRIADAGHETYAASPPTPVIAIDQFEELFHADNEQAVRVLDLIAGTIASDENILVVATIRSDTYEKLQAEPRLANVPHLPFGLAPISLGAFKEVIEGPARLAIPPLQIDPALTERLLQDLAAEDALPLLAFTLERLAVRSGRSSKLSLENYDKDLGGLKGAITKAVDAAFSSALADTSLPEAHGKLEALAHAAFIPALVQIDDAGAEPRRRVARLSELPPSTHTLVRHLINERLLIGDRRNVDGVPTDTIEVAHEAILRQWPALKSWIAEERDSLRALQSVRMAAKEWKAHAPQEGWLVHRGGRLADAESLTLKSEFAEAFGRTERDYLASCRVVENADILRERRSLERTRKLQRIVGFALAFAAIVVGLGGYGLSRLVSGHSQRTSDTLAALSLNASYIGDDERVARFGLAGLVGADWPVIGFKADRADAALRFAVAQSPGLAVLRGHADKVSSASFSPDGTRIVSASDDHTARLWDARSGRLLAILRGHIEGVRAAAFSPDGLRIVTASLDGSARIWDGRTGRALLVMRGNVFPSAGLAFNADGSRVVTAGTDNNARLWDTRTGRTLAVLHHDSHVISATLSPDGTRIVTTLFDNTARLWDARTGQQIAALRGHEENITSVAFSSDGTRIVTASHDKTARLWDANSGHQLAVLAGHEDSVFDAAFSADGARIVTASFDRTARLWDARSGQLIAIMRGHTSAVQAAVFSPDSNLIATASWDATARLWDGHTGAPIAVLRGHTSALNSAEFSPDSSRVVTASDDKTVRLWSAKAQKPPVILAGTPGEVTGASFSPDGSRVLTTSFENSARLWDATSGHVLAVLRGHQAGVWRGSFCPDGTRVVTASLDKTAREWDARTGRLLAVLRGHTGTIDAVEFSPDGTRIVTASDDKTARIWDADTGQPIAVLRGHTAQVSGAVFSPDGSQIATAGSFDKTARLWDAKTGRPLAVLRGHDSTVNSVAFNPDGTRIVTASNDWTARIWDSRTGRSLAILRHENNVNDAEFSPDGKRALTASDDKTARLWDAMTGRRIAALEGHGSAIYVARFSPDGTHIVTASADKTAILWDATTGQPLAILLGHGDAVWGAAFSRDGKKVVTASVDKTARIWTLPPALLESRGELIREACNKTLSNGRSTFGDRELKAVPSLDPRLDADPCNPPSVTARLGELFFASR